MPYASCNQCKYQCRLGTHLLDKHIRCPKCSAVVKVVAQLTDPLEAAAVPKDSEAPDIADLYVGKLIERRGPLSVSQLQLLARWNLIDVEDMISNQTTTKRSTVREFLAYGNWPPPPRPTKKKGLQPPRLPSVKNPIPERPLHATVQYPLDIAETGELQVEGVHYDEFGRAMMPDEFRTLIDRAVQMEKHAQTVETARPENTIEIYVPGPAARFVRGEHFASGYRAVAFVYVVNAIVSCFFCTAIMGMLFKRLLKLSTSVFIPFQNATELIEGEPLLQCGMALVLLTAQFIVPIWLLMRDDCVVWHCMGATVLGLMLGMAMKPEWLWFAFEAVRASAFFTGIGVCGIAAWMSSGRHAEGVSGRIHFAAFVAAAMTLTLTAVNVEQLFVVEMDALSPRITGAGLNIAVFAVCFFGVMIAVPIAICSIIDEESPAVVRQFMMQKLITAIAIGAVGGISSLCIVYPQATNFLNVPMAMLPLACANMLAVLTPPVLWLLDPEYSLARD